MSTLFGVPPPPRPEVFEPGSQVPVGEPGRAPEVDPWRRRGAVALTFVAASLLVLANLASWVHFTALRAQTARTTVASATIDQVRPAVVASLDAAVNDAVDTQVPSLNASTTATAGTTAASTVSAGVDKAVRTAVASDAFRAAWGRSLATTADHQRALAHGAASTDEDAAGVVVTLPTTELAAAITQTLVTDGYTSAGGIKLRLPAYTVTTTDTAADHRLVLGAADNLWWLLLLGAIACGAGALYLSSRRLRLGVFMALDAAAVLVICLILVPLIQQVVDDQAVDPAQAPLLLDGYRAVTHSLVVQTVVLIVIALCSALVLGSLARSDRSSEQPEPAA